MRTIGRGLFMGLLIMSGAPALQAQVASAQLTGVVRDQDGAVLPGATVTTSNPATAQRRVVMTNSLGLYTTPGLSPGEYEVRSNCQGSGRWFERAFASRPVKRRAWTWSCSSGPSART